MDAAQLADDELEAQIADLGNQIAERRPHVREAKQALERATGELRDAERQVAAKESELRSTQETLNRKAIALYKSSAISNGAEIYIGSESMNQAQVRIAAYRAMLRDEQRVIGGLSAARSDLEEDRQLVEKKQAEADAAHRVQAEELSRLSQLEASRKAAERVLEKRIKELQAEVAALEAEEEKIRATIAEQMGLAERSLVGRSGAPSKRGMIWPTQGVFTSKFGMRWGRLHAGIDIAAPTGTPIRAAATGQVISAGNGGGYGNLMLVAHGGGIVTAYAHQSRFGAGAGQVVAQGEVIGYVGSTGHSTGPHLHFEVRVNGSPTDPLEWL